MTARRRGEHPHMPDTLRHYPITIGYIVVAITIILILLIWDRFDGPTPSVCTVQTATSQGEHR